jgi:hypothetical protein
MTGKITPLRLREFSLSAGLIVLSFLIFAKQPYSVVSDAGYQALSALQFLRHEVGHLNSVRLASPADLSRTVECPLLLWAPFAAYAFFGGLKLGLATGATARLLALLASLAGGAGWVWVSSILGLKGWRRVLGVALASLYCIRTHIESSMGTADGFVYAFAPWLIGAGVLLSARAQLRLRLRTIGLAALLSLACGAVYWVKYSAILMSIAIVGAVALSQLRCALRGRAPALVGALLLYVVALGAGPVALRALNYSRSGSDLLDVSVKRNRPRTVEMFRSFVAEETLNASAVLFSPQPGLDRVTEGHSDTFKWLLRTPGLLLLGMLLWLGLRYLPPHFRDTAFLLAAVPLIAFPALSMLGRTRFTTAIERACLPSWIFLELILLLLTGEVTSSQKVLKPKIRMVLAALAASQILFFLWTPVTAARGAFRIARRPKYDSTANALYATELSRISSRKAVARIHSVVKSRNDVIVPATYSDRAFGTDTWIELNSLGRLEPLNTGPFALERTQGEGGNYLAQSPVLTSQPLRVILVAPDPYHRPNFRASVDRIRNRFTQATRWTQMPATAGDAYEIWTADLEPDLTARR